MKENFTIFYSWQSDLKGSSNRNFIQSCIEKAIKEIIKENVADIELQINLDRDTKNKSGSPLIADTIFEKIRNSNIFIADVTIINNSNWNKLLNNRVTPNPNVLVELGYAIHLLGWEKTICINNLEFSKTEQLPFDIRGHRITTYSRKKENAKRDLTATLKSAIKSIVENYEEITASHNVNAFLLHDKEILRRFNEISTEERFFDSLSYAEDNLFMTKYYYNIWDAFTDYYRKSVNHFIDKDLDTDIKDLIEKLDAFNSITMKHFFARNENRGPSPFELKEQGVNVTKDMEVEYSKDERYSIVKDALRNESFEDAGKRVKAVRNELLENGAEVRKAYKKLIMSAKKKGII